MRVHDAAHAPSRGVSPLAPRRASRRQPETLTESPTHARARPQIHAPEHLLRWRLVSRRRIALPTCNARSELTQRIVTRAPALRLRAACVLRPSVRAYHTPNLDRLPSIDILNVYELPEGRTVTHGIFDGPNGSVAWYKSLHGVYFTPMDFHKFPFDSQHLDIQFMMDPSLKPPVRRFIPSATSNRYIVKGEGDTVSGWDVRTVTIKPFKELLREQLNYFIGTFGSPSAPTDPVPLTGESSAGGRSKARQHPRQPFPFPFPFFFPFPFLSLPLPSSPFL